MESKKFLKISFSTLSATFFVMLNYCFVFASSKKVVDTAQSTSLSNFSVGELAAATGISVVLVILVFGIATIIYSLFCIPFLKKANRPVSKVFIPFVNLWTIYAVGGSQVALLALVGSILVSCFVSPSLAFIPEFVANYLLIKKFTNYGNNQIFSILLAVIFGPIAIGFGNHTYKG